MFNKPNLFFILGIILGFLFFVTYQNVYAQSNMFLDSKIYIVVQVEKNDTLWSIAEKHITNQNDIRDLIRAIKYINHIDESVSIYPGQELKVPLITST
jgi:hypothetical protein